MDNLNILSFEPSTDPDNQFVDFSLIRESISIEQFIADSGVTKLSEPNEEGEARGKCPTCEKERAFALNVGKNQFNCFSKQCKLKGGGVIDFASKLYKLSAKEASHLLACAYGLEPYDKRGESKQPAQTKKEAPKASNGQMVSISKKELDRLNRKAAKYDQITQVVVG